MIDRLLIYDKITGKTKYIVLNDIVIDVSNCNHEFTENKLECVHCGLYPDEIYKENNDSTIN